MANKSTIPIVKSKKNSIFAPQKWKDLIDCNHVKKC